MRKIINLLYIVFLSLFIVTSCRRNNLGEKSKYADNVNNLEGVSLELNQKQYKSEGDTFELTTLNDSEKEISYGVPFILEYFEEGAWYEVKPDQEMAFVLILYTLPPGDQASDKLNLEYYEPLKPGHYRIVREIEDQALTAEFEVIKE